MSDERDELLNAVLALRTEHGDGLNPDDVKRLVQAILDAIEERILQREDYRREFE